MPLSKVLDKFFAGLQHCLPTRLLSTLVHRIACSKKPWLKTRLIRWFLRFYQIDLSQAQRKDPFAYQSLNDFFTRALEDGTRPLEGSDSHIISPVDGRLGAWGEIAHGQLFQAKGMNYSLSALLGQHMPWHELFIGGQFATCYLAPHNYHRVHMPLQATLKDCLYIPGRLFGVNPRSVRSIARLFTRNERLVSIFDTPAGPMASIMVSAFCVGGIETVWNGTVCPPHTRGNPRWLARPQQPVHFKRGAEMGRFNLGSTVILLFTKDAIHWQPNIHTGMELTLGQSLGWINPH